jgi:hypothetical protein
MPCIGYGEFEYFENMHKGMQEFEAINHSDRKIAVNFCGTKPVKLLDTASRIQAYMKYWKSSGKLVYRLCDGATLRVASAVIAWLDTNLARWMEGLACHTRC